MRAAAGAMDGWLPTQTQHHPQLGQGLLTMSHCQSW
jgi:hypothetical protein